MRKQVTITLAAFFVVCTTAGTASAQEEVFQRGIEFGVGARALGMGGAYIGVADDYSAAYWNPAALTQIRRLEGFGTISHGNRSDEISSSFSTQTSEATFTNFNSLGLAYPIPTFRGSLVFSFGYHRVRPFDGKFNYELFNNTPGDSVMQRWSELEDGSLDNWTLAGATEVAPNFSVGAALNFWTGKNDYQYSFIEEDILDLYTFSKYRHDDNLVSKFSGANLKLAALYRASLFRFGLTLATPTTLTITDNWKTRDETDFEDGGVDATSDRGEFEYKIRSPFSIGAGASLNMLGLVVSGGLEMNDWSQTRYVSEPPISGLSEAEANDELANKYRNTTRVRLGAEFTLPLIDLQLRAGYLYDPIPLANMPNDADREFITAGLGLFLDKQVRLDIALMTGQWNEYKQPLDDLSGDSFSVSEKITYTKALATLAVRF